MDLPVGSALFMQIFQFFFRSSGYICLYTYMSIHTYMWLINSSKYFFDNHGPVSYDGKIRFLIYFLNLFRLSLSYNLNPKKRGIILPRAVFFYPTAKMWLIYHIYLPLEGNFYFLCLIFFTPANPIGVMRRKYFFLIESKKLESTRYRSTFFEISKEW